MSRQQKRATALVGQFFGKAREQQGGQFGQGHGSSQVARPYRALAPGKQYIGGDRVGGKAAERRLRQSAKLELKRLRKEHGITSPMFQGMGPGGALLLEVPAAGPTRAVPPDEDTHVSAIVVESAVAPAPEFKNHPEALAKRVAVITDVSDEGKS